MRAVMKLLALLLIITMLTLSPVSTASATDTKPAPAPTPTLKESELEPLARATRCRGQKSRHIMPQDADTKFWYPLGGVDVYAKMRLTLRQIYDNCPNRAFPAWGMPMAWEQCWRVIDYASTRFGNLPDALYKHQFHIAFTGVSFRHVVYQKASSKETSPLRYETDDDRSRSNCRLIQEAVDDRVKFRFITGHVGTGWHASVAIAGRNNPTVSRARWWRPREDRRIPSVG